MSKIVGCIILFIFCISLSQQAQAQDYKFGIRAGLNYSQLLGPTISESTHQDKFTLNNGIHFGVTFAYHLSDNFGFRTELAYNQIGTKYTFTSDNAPYVFRNGLEREPRRGKIERFLDVNNSYIHLPFMVFVKPHRKVELYGGIYTQFLVLPTAGGKIDFTDPKDPADYSYSFIQSIEANYNSDAGREAKGNQGLTVALDIDGERQDITMARLIGGYYELDDSEKKASKYNWFDAGLEGGASYFINNSLYVGLTGMYGLFDVTNDKVDIDYYNLDEFNKYKFKDDFDRNFSLQISLGFKF